MKPDKLEHFVRENRAEFNTNEPVPDVWDAIEKRPEKMRYIHTQWRSILGKAAAALAIFVGSYYFHAYNAQHALSDDTAINSSEEKMDPLYREIAEAENYYTTEIIYKKQELFELTGSTPELHQEVNDDLEELNLKFLELKEDLKDDADNQEVIEAMMQNLRLRLEILEDLLYQIRSIQGKNYTNEKENDNFL